MKDHLYIKMSFIEEIVQEFVSIYNSKNEKEISHKAKVLVRKINRDEFQFTQTAHPYAMATALYYLLSDEAKLTEEECIPVAKLTYYCLLKNYLENSNTNVDDAKYTDFIGGCKLGIIFMTKFMRFIAFSVISGIAHYIPDAARKHLGHQILLFHKIVENAETMHFHHFFSEELEKEYREIILAFKQYMPKVTDISALKQKCSPIMEQICKDIESDCAMNTEF